MQVCLREYTHTLSHTEVHALTGAHIHGTSQKQTCTPLAHYVQQFYDLSVVQKFPAIFYANHKYVYEETSPEAEISGKDSRPSI